MAKYKHYKMLNKIEVWKDVVGYEGLYIVSSMGRIMSLDRIVKDRWGNDRNKEGRIISLNKKKHGYFHVNLYKDKIRKTHSVHRLVAVAFIPNTFNLPQINHKDENPSNNCVENLEWCDSKYNNNYGGHYERVAKSVSGERNGMYGKTHSKEIRKKMSENSTTKIKIYCIETNKIYSSITEVCEELNLNINNTKCVTISCKSFYDGNYKSCKGYHFLYAEDYEKLKKENRDWENILDKIKNCKPYGKRVYCIELDKTFNSIKEASDELNIDYSGISKVCRGKQETCGEYHWKYVKD